MKLERAHRGPCVRLLRARRASPTTTTTTSKAAASAAPSSLFVLNEPQSRDQVTMRRRPATGTRRRMAQMTARVSSSGLEIKLPRPARAASSASRKGRLARAKPARVVPTARPQS